MFKFLKRLFGFGKTEEVKPTIPTIDYNKVVYHTEPEQAPAAVWEVPTPIVEEKVEEPKQERTSPAERGIDQLGLPKLPSNEGTKPTKKRRPYKKRKPKTMKPQENQG